MKNLIKDKRVISGKNAALKVTIISLTSEGKRLLSLNKTDRIKSKTKL